jgi:chromosome segregation ATPase
VNRLPASKPPRRWNRSGWRTRNQKRNWKAAQALATERQRLRDEALSQRDALRTELDVVRRDATLATEQLQRNFWEQRSAAEQRVDALSAELGQARLSLAEHRSQLDARQRENTNLTTINSGLSVRIDRTQSALASTEAQLAALDAQRTVEQREMITLQQTTIAILPGR